MRGKKGSWLLSLTIMTIFLISSFIVIGQTATKLPKKFERGDIEPLSKRVAIGPYPSRDEIKVIKKSGFNNIIVFLNPKIPHERELLKKEKKAIKGTGVKLISLPLWPYVSDSNKKNLDRMAKIIKDNPKQKYYMHCFLGLHRVTYAKARVLRMMGRKTQVQTKTPMPEELERGKVVKLKKGIYFGPAPTAEEVFELYSARVKTIIVVLNRDDRDDRKVIKEAKRLAAGYNVTFHNVSMLPERSNPQGREKLAEILEKAKRPVYIGSFFGPDRPNSRDTDVRAAVEEAK